MGIVFGDKSKQICKQTGICGTKFGPTAGTGKKKSKKKTKKNK